MPNHCYQQVHIEGPYQLVKTLYHGLTENGFDHDNLPRIKNPQFCQLVVPMPFEQWLAPKTKWGDYEVEGWYDWRCENWGTKWEVCDVEIDEEVTLHDDERPDGEPYSREASFAFRCWTAWGPPTPVWDKLHRMGISVHADYQDEGGMFEGEYINGQDRSWEPEFEEEEEAHVV